MMTLLEMINTARSEVRDNAMPPHCSDDQFIQFANDAEREACRRARLLIDSTSDFCTLDVTAGDPLAELDSRVIFVRRAKVVGQTRPLVRVCFRDLDEECPGWEESAGSITHFITDLQTGFLRAYRIPTVDTSVALTVVRLPLNDMKEDDDKPEISARYHESLIHWMKYRYYMIRDADVFDEDAALKSLALFEQEFGKRSSAVDEEWIEREQQLPFDGTY